MNERENDENEMAGLLERSQIARVVYGVEDLKLAIRKTLGGFRDSEKGLCSVNREKLITTMKTFFKKRWKLRQEILFEES